MKNCYDKRIAIMGLELTPLTMMQLNAKIAETIITDTKKIIANHNLHSLYLCQNDQKLHNLFDKAALIHIDGMSLVFFARLLGFRVSKEQRVTYVDWIWPLMSEAERMGWRVFFLGSKPGVGEAALKKLKKEYPTLNFRTHHGYFDNIPDSEENLRVLKRINSFRPNILMVGMGMPRQEHWIIDNFDRIDVNVILTAGACMDYLAGTIPTPPRWLGRIGLEWLYRFACEPRRLGKRYLMEPWFMFGPMMKEIYLRLPGKREQE